MRIKAWVTFGAVVGLVINSDRIDGTICQDTPN